MQLPQVPHPLRLLLPTLAAWCDLISSCHIHFPADLILWQFRVDLTPNWPLLSVFIFMLRGPSEMHWTWLILIVLIIAAQSLQRIISAGHKHYEGTAFRCHVGCCEVCKNIVCDEKSKKFATFILIRNSSKASGNLWLCQTSGETVSLGLLINFLCS